MDKNPKDASHRGTNRTWLACQGCGRPVLVGKGNRTPALRPSGSEMAVRQAAKERIFAKYGLSSWHNAPVAALGEYETFLKARTGAKK